MMVEAVWLSNERILRGSERGWLAAVRTRVVEGIGPYMRWIVRVTSHLEEDSKGWVLNHGYFIRHTPRPPHEQPATWQNI